LPIQAAERIGSECPYLGSSQYDSRQLCHAQVKDIVLRKLRPASAAHVLIDRLPPRRGITPSLDWLSDAEGVRKGEVEGGGGGGEEFDQRSPVPLPPFPFPLLTGVWVPKG